MSAGKETQASVDKIGQALGLEVPEKVVNAVELGLEAYKSVANLRLSMRQLLTVDNRDGLNPTLFIVFDAFNGAMGSLYRGLQDLGQKEVLDQLAEKIAEEYRSQRGQ